VQEWENTRNEAAKWILCFSLMNLMANSRYALLKTQRAGVVSFRTSLSEAGRTLLEASDSGPGIPEALPHRPSIFFYDQTSGRGHRMGTLHRAGLVRQHGGQIRGHHRTPQGAGFALDFPPAAAGPQLLTKERSPVRSVAGPPILWRTRKRILPPPPALKNVCRTCSALHWN